MCSSWILFCYFLNVIVRFYLREEAMNAIRYVSGTKLDDRIIRTDWDMGFEEGRQFGRGRSGGQVRSLWPCMYMHCMWQHSACRCVMITGQITMTVEGDLEVGLIHHSKKQLLKLIISTTMTSSLNRHYLFINWMHQGCANTSSLVKHLLIIIIV